MKKHTSSFFALLLVVGLVFSQLTLAKKTIPKEARPTNITGAQDRKYWSDLLYRMSLPVVKNLAEGTLSKNMPIEKSPTYSIQNSNVSYLEAVGRTLAGIAPWLALPDDNTPEGAMRKELRNYSLKGIANAVNPASPDYLNFRSEYQPIVDAAYLVHAFVRAPKALWEPLDSLTKTRVITELQALRTRKAWYNNWLLFSGLTEAFLMEVKAPYDPVRIDYAQNKIQEWYVGDGWYSDGPQFSLDYYNSFVIHPMMVDMIGLMVKNKKISAKTYDLAQQRLTRNAEFLERFIQPDGTFPVFGRSITYRTGTMQSLAQAALMGKLPEGVSNAQTRCALTAVMHRMYDEQNNFDTNGWLVLGFCGHQADIADYYTSTGSLYMATLGFLDLGLPATHPFWTDAAEDWTSKKAWSGSAFKKDYHVEY